MLGARVPYMRTRIIKGKADVGVIESKTETFVAKTQRAMMSRVVENEVWRGRYGSYYTRSCRPSELWILCVTERL